jgi:hypothetical protein
MSLKPTTSNLNRLENIFKQGGYTLRYEKGNFKSGYCIIKQQKVIVVNQYYPLEGKVNCLVEILQNVDWQFAPLEEKENKIYQELIKQKQDLFTPSQK